MRVRPLCSLSSTLVLLLAVSTVACTDTSEPESEVAPAASTADAGPSAGELVDGTLEALAAGPLAFSVTELEGDEVQRQGRLLVASATQSDRRFLLTWETDPGYRVASDGESVFASRPDGDVWVSSWSRAGSVLFQQEAGKLVVAALNPGSFGQYGSEIVSTAGGLTAIRTPLPGGGAWELGLGDDGLPRRLAYRASAETAEEALELTRIDMEVPTDEAAYRLEPAAAGESVEFFAGPRPGESVPPMAFDLAEGSTVAMDDLRGSAVALDFWATWCVPCKPAMQELEVLHQEFGEEGLRVFGLRLYDEGDATAFLEELGVTYPIGDGATVAEPLAVDQYGLPTLYVLDRQGRVVDLFIGFNAETSPPRVRQAVLDALSSG